MTAIAYALGVELHQLLGAAPPSPKAAEAGRLVNALTEAEGEAAIAVLRALAAS